jgi:membrane dipeptidase
MLARFPLIDGHNDLPWALRERARQNGGDLSQVAFDLDTPAAGLHTDLPRLAAVLVRLRAGLAGGRQC